MRKHCRNRVRSRKNRILTIETRQVALYDYAQIATRWTDWSFRTVSLARAMRMVGEGKAEALTRRVDGELRTIYRRTRPERVIRRSASTLTKFSLEAVSGEREGARALAEITKVVVWPLIGDTKARCVRPRLSEEERRYAQQVLDAGRLVGA